MRTFFAYLYIASSIVLSVGRAQASPWNTPVSIDDSRASLKFTVVTESGTVRGSAQNISGRVWLKSLQDPNSIQSLVTVPVANMEAAGDSRLQQVKTLLLLAGLQEVQVRVDKMSGNCLPDRVPCQANLEGSVELQGVQHPIIFPVAIVRQGAKYLVAGNLKLSPAQIAPELVRRLTQTFVREFTLSYRLLL